MKLLEVQTYRPFAQLAGSEYHVHCNVLCEDAAELRIVSQHFEHTTYVEAFLPGKLDRPLISGSLSTLYDLSTSIKGRKFFTIQDREAVLLNLRHKKNFMELLCDYDPIGSIYFIQLFVL